MGALTLIGVSLTAVGWDWLAVTRMAAYSTDFDYRYWPLSRSRQIGLGSLVLTAAYAWATAGPGGPLWLLIPPMILLGVWLVTALNDLETQRRTGYREPPRYSDRE